MLGGLLPRVLRLRLGRRLALLGLRVRRLAVPSARLRVLLRAARLRELLRTALLAGIEAPGGARVGIARVRLARLLLAGVRLARLLLTLVVLARILRLSLAWVTLLLVRRTAEVVSGCRLLALRSLPGSTLLRWLPLRRLALLALRP